MKTLVQIDGRTADGTCCPPHLTVDDADFVPRTGDFVKFGTHISKVTQVEYEYATVESRYHVVHVTTAG